MARLARPASEVRARYDAIVIGSGYGGGVAASRLSRMGLKVALLERGREILPGEFPTNPWSVQLDTQMRVAGRRVGAATGLFDVRVGRDVHVVVGCGVGGTSLINANVCLNPDAQVLEDERWPSALRTDHYLNVGFHRARAMLAPVPLPDSATPLKLAALEKAAKALGRDVERVPLHITFEETTNAAGVRQPACTQCGDCLGGCNVGAKTTVHSTYLADAVNHGAEIFSGAEVRFIERAADKSWRVVFRTAGEALRIVPQRSVMGAQVVVAAGTLGSNEILMRSRDRGLKLSDQLGRRISTNADAVSFGYDNDIPVNGIGVGHPAKSKVPPPGPAVSGMIDLRRRREPNDRLAIVEAAVQSSMAAVLPLMLPAGAALANMGGEGKGLEELIAGIKSAGESLVSGAYDGPVHKTQIFLAVGHDSGSGEIVLDGEDLSIRWPHAVDEPIFKAIDATLTKIVTATGGKYVPNPVSRQFLGGNLLTVHPLGGCAMGESSATGVVDHKCRVFDTGAGNATSAVHDGLLVCDGSVMPRSLGVHPLLTITAVAERAMLLLARDRGVALDVAPMEDVPVRGFVEPAGTSRRTGWRRAVFGGG